ncbi:hypothetical protein BRADI_4g13263v3 [Brachypodium distachyon]|uniref:Uncharacterized protein n=1 Tax=Brachypodium distachyon TaxID=15368 RepID=A0A0Q3H2U1_BRADI|nr:hypothetical protein BRADI_4g13263v3 [Brachypodium distachyon]
MVKVVSKNEARRGNRNTGNRKEIRTPINTAACKPPTPPSPPRPHIVFLLDLAKFELEVSVIFRVPSFVGYIDGSLFLSMDRYTKFLCFLEEKKYPLKKLPKSIKISLKI